MHPSTDPEPLDRWRTIARTARMPISPDRLERIAPVLEALEMQTRKALDRDLSLVEPAPVFAPSRRQADR